jgi:hypothetical protein
MDYGDNLPSELYHGSSHMIQKLEPRPSRVIDGEEAVFATNSRAMAVVFLPKWDDTDFQLGVHHNKIYMIENYPNAFDILKARNERGVAGYLYTVSSDGFQSDPRLGMKSHEFIKKDEVEILRTEVIEDAYEFLQNSPDISMVTFDQMIDCLIESGLIAI